MQWKRVTVLCQAVATCALWVSGLFTLQSAVQGQTGQETTTEKALKPKKPKKSASDTTPSPTATPAEVSGKKATAPVPVANASQSEIQSAKTEGKVWVNTDSGVYHKSGKWFGATKQGKFMSEQDAIKAGYRAAKNEK